MNWVFQLPSHNLIFLFRLISLGNRASIYSLAKHASQKLGFLSQARRFFLIFSSTNYNQPHHPSYYRVLLSCLGRCPKIHSLSSRQSPVQNYSSHQQCLPREILPTSFSFPESYNLPSFKSEINKLDGMSLSS